MARSPLCDESSVSGMAFGFALMVTVSAAPPLPPAPPMPTPPNTLSVVELPPLPPPPPIDCAKMPCESSPRVVRSRSLPITTLPPAPPSPPLPPTETNAALPEPPEPPPPPMLCASMALDRLPRVAMRPELFTVTVLDLLPAPPLPPVPPMATAGVAARAAAAADGLRQDAARPGAGRVAEPRRDDVETRVDRAAIDDGDRAALATGAARAADGRRRRWSCRHCRRRRRWTARGCRRPRAGAWR